MTKCTFPLTIGRAQDQKNSLGGTTET